MIAWTFLQNDHEFESVTQFRFRPHWALSDSYEKRIEYPFLAMTANAIAKTSVWADPYAQGKDTWRMSKLAPTIETGENHFIE